MEVIGMTECFGCGRKNKKNGYPKFTFNGKKYKLKLDNAKLVCEVCTENQFLLDFNRFKGQIIKNGKDIAIDWRSYFKLQDELKTSLGKILVTLGILDYQSQGNWEIAEKGKNLNPKIKRQPLYFKKESDVCRFVSVNYPWTYYDCEIRRISRVITREEFNA